MFQPSQIRWKDDTVADGQAEDTEFDDTNLDWRRIHDPNRPKVMNDVGKFILLRGFQSELTLWDRVVLRSLFALPRLSGPLLVRQVLFQPHSKLESGPQKACGLCQILNTQTAKMSGSRLLAHKRSLRSI